MYCDSKHALVDELQSIVVGTTTLSFPAFLKKDEKNEIISCEKAKVESQINEACVKYHTGIFLNRSDFEKLWQDAKSTSSKKFSSIPKKYQINSFYLQELLHEYTTQITELILKELS